MMMVEEIEAVRIAGKPHVIGKRRVPMSSQEVIRDALRTVAIHSRRDGKHEGVAAMIVLNAWFHR